MNYKLLNSDQRKRMRRIINNEFEMEWEEPDFFNTLIGKFVPIISFIVLTKKKVFERFLKALSGLDIALLQQTLNDVAFSLCHTKACKTSRT